MKILDRIDSYRVAGINRRDQIKLFVGYLLRPVTSTGRVFRKRAAAEVKRRSCEKPYQVSLMRNLCMGVMGMESRGSHRQPIDTVGCTANGSAPVYEKMINHSK